MKRFVSSLLVAVLGLACWAPVRAGEPAAPSKIRVLLTYGGHGFEEKPFFAMFDALPNITVTKAPLPKSAELLKPGLQKDCDVIVMYDMIGKFSPDQQKAFTDLLQQGIGLVSLHHNMGAHQGWDEFRKIIGGKFVTVACEIDGQKYGISPWEHGQDLKVTIADKDHPITRGLKDFTIHDETYGKYYVAPDVKVLLTTDNPKNDPKIAWVKEYGKSRVFYFMLGHDLKAWENPAYPEILVRGIRWAAGKQ
jgi:uncharacterized protein